jgi:cell division protein FtsB
MQAKRAQPRNRYQLGSLVDWPRLVIDCRAAELSTGAMEGNETSPDKQPRFASARYWCVTASFSRRKFATAAAALLVLAVGYHVIFGAHGLTAYQQKRQETLSLKAELQSLQHENEALKDHVDRLQKDPEAIEQQAREDLHYTRPGEVLYALPTPPAADASQPADPQSDR